MSSDQIIAKLMKLLALARNGVGGEKENAASVLEKLLAKHCLTIEDLDDAAEERTTYWFTPTGKSERVLLAQCVTATVAGWNGDIWSNKAERGAQGYDLTHAEHMQVSLMFDVHRRALKKHIEKQRKLALLSYIHTNGLYSAKDEDQPTKPSSLSEEDIKQIISMVRGMKPTPVHRAIEQGVSE